MKTHTLLGLSAFALITGCKPANDPASTCTASMTAEGLTSLAFDGTGVPLQEVHLGLDAPVLDGFDRSTKKTSCTATFHLTFSGTLSKLDPAKGQALMENGAQINGVPGPQILQVLSGRQAYTIQTAADGKGLVYTLSREQIGALRSWLLASQLASQAAADVPAVAAPTSDTPMAKSGPSEDNETDLQENSTKDDLSSNSEGGPATSSEPQ